MVEWTDRVRRIGLGVLLSSLMANAGWATPWGKMAPILKGEVQFRSARPAYDAPIPVIVRVRAKDFEADWSGFWRDGVFWTDFFGARGVFWTDVSVSADGTETDIAAVQGD